jgi:hypothetical protein
MSVRVVNTAKERPTEYIGRAWAGRPASPLGNPFKLKGEETRGAAIQSYRKWLWKKWQEGGAEKEELLRIARQVKAGEAVTLGCWCHPHPCHGDVVAKAVMWIIEEGLV